MTVRSAASKIMSLDQAKAFAEQCRAGGQRLVLANGCFDLLHGGHVSYLEGARGEGDALIVGVNSDASERKLKGPGRPIIPQEERAELVAGMGAVDAVVIFDEPDCEKLLRALRPDVHAKGTDYTTETVPERAIARELGIRVAIAGAAKENNSKDIIAAVKQMGI
jgi:rfaE bifunctional protein nucleotidyltransferase chain/domain